MKKHTYGIFEAKTHFSEIIRAVKSGRKVRISERGTDVAVISPLDPEEQPSNFEQLVARGEIVRGTTGRAKNIVPLDEKLTARTGAVERFLKTRD